jgi:hypothetical protein
VDFFSAFPAFREPEKELQVPLEVSGTWPLIRSGFAERAKVFFTGELARHSKFRVKFMARMDLREKVLNPAENISEEGIDSRTEGSANEAAWRRPRKFEKKHGGYPHAY